MTLTNDLVGNTDTVAGDIANKNRLWALRNALTKLKEEQGKHWKGAATSTPQKDIAIFLQLGINLSLLPDMTTCLANVASVVFSRDAPDSVKQPLALDLYVSVLQKDKRKAGSIKDFFRTILPTDSNVYMISTPNVGADIGAFLAQLKQMNQHKRDEKKQIRLVSWNLFVFHVRARL
jgi:hypothetical protein